MPFECYRWKKENREKLGEMLHLPVKLSAAFTDGVLTMQTTSNSIKVNKKCRLWLCRLRFWHRRSSAPPPQSSQLSAPQLFRLLILAAACDHNDVAVMVFVLECLSEVGIFLAVALHKFLDIVLPEIIEDEQDNDNHKDDGNDRNNDIAADDDDGADVDDVADGKLLQDIERFLILFIDFLDDDDNAVEWCLRSFCGLDNIFAAVAVADCEYADATFSNAAAAVVVVEVASNFIDNNLFSFSHCRVLFRRLFEFLKFSKVNILVISLLLLL